MDENIRSIQSQVEIAKRLNVVAIPSALIRGRVVFVLECDWIGENWTGK